MQDQTLQLQLKLEFFALRFSNLKTESKVVT